MDKKLLEFSKLSWADQAEWLGRSSPEDNEEMTLYIHFFTAEERELIGETLVGDARIFRNQKVLDDLDEVVRKRVREMHRIHQMNSPSANDPN